MVEEQQEQGGDRRRVVLIQLDAADANVLSEGIDAGGFPNLRRIRDAGAWGLVDAPRGFGSGATWATFNTGVTPATHGRYFYRQVLPGTYEARPFEGEDLLVPPFWEWLSDAGRRVAVFDAPSQGISPGINGISVADWITHDLVYPGVRTSPPELADELTRRFGTNPVRKCDQPGGRDRAGHQLLVQQLVDRVAQKSRAVRHYLAGDDWDFFSVAFAEPHCVGHQCWHLRDPLHALYDPDDAAAVPDPVVRVYGAIDEAIGEIREVAGPDTTVVVFSATSMGPNYTGNLILDEVLRRIDGVQATPQVSATWSLKQRLKRVLPLSVRQRYRPLKRRIEESLQAGDRARRNAFMVPHNDISGAIRLNVVGREANGRLRPGPEVDDYIASLRTELLALRNLDTGEPVIDEIVRVSDACKGPALDQLPDLFAVWSRNAYPDRIGSERIGEIRYRHRGNRTGDHRLINVFYAMGPGITPGRMDGLSICDFAPSMAGMLDVAPRQSDGRVVEALVGDSPS